MRTFLAICLLLLSSMAGAEPIAPGDIEVTDGDTIDARGRTYRLVGFDTPEFWSRNRKVPLKEKRLALIAAERLQELVDGGGLTLTEAPCSCPKRKVGTKRCNWGRKCGILAVDGKNVGDVLISEGLAREYLCTKTKCPSTQPWP